MLDAFSTKKQIITINKLITSHHGGNFVSPNNLLNESALDYLFDAVYAGLFRQKLYPLVFDKAGIYIFNIISNHVFSDGNKRTGLKTGLLFLKLNGHQHSDTVTNVILTDFIISIASAK